MGKARWNPDIYSPTPFHANSILLHDVISSTYLPLTPSFTPLVTLILIDTREWMTWPCGTLRSLSDSRLEERAMWPSDTYLLFYFVELQFCTEWRRLAWWWAPDSFLSFFRLCFLFSRTPIHIHDNEPRKFYRPSGGWWDGTSMRGTRRRVHFTHI